jgi:hypothetical protein
VKLLRISFFCSLLILLLFPAASQAQAAGSPPVLLAPARSSTPTVIRPVFDWSDAPNATAYTITISAYSNFAYPLVNKTVSASTYTPTVDLKRKVRLYWRVRVSQPYISTWVTSYFTAPNPPYSPAPISPGLNAIVTTFTPKLDWGTSVIPTGTVFAYYQLQVDDNADYSSPLLDRKETAVAGHAYTFPSALAANTVFYWRVRTANTLGQFSMWRTSAFRTSLLPPTLLSPAYLEVPNNLRPLLDWNDVPGATGYGVEVSLYPDFSSKVITLAVTESQYQPQNDLPRNKVLYWRVRTHGTAISAWSNSSFTSPNPTDPVKLLSPIGLSYVNNTPTLDWTQTIVPVDAQFAYYQLQVSKGDFSILFFETTINNIAQHAFTFTPQNQLDPANGSWHWRVRTANTANQFSAWATGDFLTYPPTVTPTPTRTPTATPTPYLAPLTQLYTNIPAGFSFYYPADAMLTDDDGMYYARISLAIVPGTNLGSKYLEARAWDASRPCESPIASTETSHRMETINGLSFFVQEGQDRGAGNIYDWVSYSTIREAWCVNMLFVLHSTNPDMYQFPPPLFNKTTESAVFGQMVNTFAWLPATATPTPTLVSP